MKTFAIGLLSSMLLTQCSAQQVAKKDLSDFKPKAVSTHAIPLGDKCGNNYRISMACGFEIPPLKEELILELVSVEPRTVSYAQKVKVTIRLKNNGDSNVLVPWNEEYVEPVVNDSNPHESNVRSAVWQLRLTTGKDPKQITWLKGSIWLHAAPNETKHFVELLPGNWVELTFTSTLECGSNEKLLCSEHQPDQSAELTAEYMEWNFAKTVKDCEVTNGNYISRELSSRPVSIVYLGKVII